MKRLAREEGFTLPELLMSITILGLIIAPLTLGFITGLRAVGKTDQKFTDSRGALISAADFASDVGNANVVRTTTSAPPAACGSGGTALVTFAWSDATKEIVDLDSNANRVTYYYDATDPANRKLIRRICKGTSSASQSTMAVALGTTQPSVTCYNPGAPTTAVACNGSGVRWVKMGVTLAPNSPTQSDPSPTPFTFTLEGTRRAT
jgi:prepilin-type N-terminal cleavage/methylation domain-containing protein